VITQEHKRVDKGVVISHELFVDDNVFIVELFRNRFTCSVCYSRTCKHALLAGEQEAKYLEGKQDNNLGSCMYCGRLAKKWRGVAICLSCSN
jgi:redox-regulated HSP33 family molecular chaperone